MQPPIDDVPGRKRIDRLVDHVDDLFIQRPGPVVQHTDPPRVSKVSPPEKRMCCQIRSNSPRRRSHLSVILQRLIRGQPDPGKDEIRDEPHDPKGGSHPSQSAHQRPLSPMHGVLQAESLGVGFIGESEELFERVAGDVGVGSAGECLFDLLAECHPG